MGDLAWDLSVDLNRHARIDFADFFIFVDQFGVSQNTVEKSPLSLALIPNLALQPQESFSLLLDQFLLTGDPVQVSWTVSEPKLTAVTIDPVSHRANLASGTLGGLEKLHFAPKPPQISFFIAEGGDFLRFGTPINSVTRAMS